MASNNNGLRVILGTGGTIAGKSSRPEDNVGYVAGQVSVEDLLAHIPGLSGVPLACEQIDQVDSKDMGFDLWKRLLLRLSHHLSQPEVAGVVITHGTDTLEETAWFLDTVLRPSKPVVLTCAMRPATALLPDGPQNLLDAVTVAGSSQAHGVWVVCAGKVHAARHVSKVHTYQLDAFDSGDAGPMACIEEGKVRWLNALPFGASYSDALANALAPVLTADALPRVDIVTSHADADGAIVRALLMAGQARPAIRGRGIVVACTGNGTIHQDLQQALAEAQASGIRIVRASRCARGTVISSPNPPFPDSEGLSPVKARLALALSLLVDDHQKSQPGKSGLN